MSSLTASSLFTPSCLLDSIIEASIPQVPHIQCASASSGTLPLVLPCGDNVIILQVLEQ